MIDRGIFSISFLSVRSLAGGSNRRDLSRDSKERAPKCDLVRSSRSTPKRAAVNDLARPGANAAPVDLPIFTYVFERLRTFAND